MKKWMPIALLVLTLALAAQGGQAQNATPAPTVAGPSTTVQIHFVACSDKAVVDLSGVTTAGRSIYYQVFSGAGGTGAALTGLRQVNGSGNYAISEVVPFANSQTVASGAVASVAVRIALTSNANSIEFQTTVDDPQDGCNNPQNPQATSVDLGGATGAATPSASTAKILAPGGAVLNANLNLPEAQVVVGARASDTFRSDMPGMIFAECDRYPQALPGLVYDTDNVVIFWSWFAKTLDQIQQQLVSGRFSVKVNTAGLPNANVSEPQEIDGNFWIFYTVPLGHLRPGHYEVEFRQTWAQQITDGFRTFGPGGSTELTASLCNFDITKLPGGAPIYNGAYNPSDFPVHDLNPAIDIGAQG